MEPEPLNAQGEFYRRAHRCPCGSGLICEWLKNEKGKDERACERCKPALLYRIFESRHLDIFEDWAGKALFHDPAPLGYEWQWEDLLKEKGCEQVVGLEEARRKLSGDRIMIPCPNGDVISTESGDRSVHILVPKEYADRVLAAGRVL